MKYGVFVDEAGDAVLFDDTDRVLIGTDTHFGPRLLQHMCSRGMGYIATTEVAY